MTAARFLANKQCRHKASECAAALGEQALAKERHCHKAAELAARMAERSLTNEQCHH